MFLNRSQHVYKKQSSIANLRVAPVLNLHLLVFSGVCQTRTAGKLCERCTSDSGGGWILWFFIPSLIHIPYCSNDLRVLYFANFCDLEKIAKLSACKNFYQHTRHSCVYNHKLLDVFWRLGSMHSHSLSVVSAFSFLPCHHQLEKVTFDDIDYHGSFTSKT